jgi:hypothetical protein
MSDIMKKAEEQRKKEQQELMSAEEKAVSNFTDKLNAASRQIEETFSNLFGGVTKTLEKYPIALQLPVHSLPLDHLQRCSAVFTAQQRSFLITLDYLEVVPLPLLRDLPELESLEWQWVVFWALLQNPLGSL